LGSAAPLTTPRLSDAARFDSEEPRAAFRIEGSYFGHRLRRAHPRAERPGGDVPGLVLPARGVRPRARV